MSYLFDPANWEWIFAGNNLRFLLQGFFINLQIAALAMVLSLVVSGSAWLSARVPKDMGETRLRACGSRCGGTCP